MLLIVEIGLVAAYEMYDVEATGEESSEDEEEVEDEEQFCAEAACFVNTLNHAVEDKGCEEECDALSC